VVIEGVHLTPDFMLNMLKKHNKCIPFLIYIKDEAKHRERFAVRSKHMTLDKKSNKYVQNFTGIRII
jgi:2-phosphoglycerate kinase